MSDYDKLYAALEAMPGAEFVDQIEIVDDPDHRMVFGNMENVIRLDFWLVGGRGVVLIVNAREGVGVYTFRGNDGDPIEDDIEYLRGLAKMVPA